MGVTLSTETTLAPVSFASSVVGFISFAFTLGTFIRVFWEEWKTFKNASSELPDLLGNLKQALYEERNHLRVIRRRCKGDYEEAAFQVLAEAIRHMIRNFKQIEEPFLADKQPNRSYSHSNGAEPKPYGYAAKEWAGESVRFDDYFHTKYKKISALGIRERLRWLRSRGDVIDMWDQLGRLQMRRISRQTTDIAVATKYLTRTIQDVEDRVNGIEQRLSRVVGVRNVN